MIGDAALASLAGAHSPFTKSAGEPINVLTDIQAEKDLDRQL